MWIAYQTSRYSLLWSHVTCLRWDPPPPFVENSPNNFVTAFLLVKSFFSCPTEGFLLVVIIWTRILWCILRWSEVYGQFWTLMRQAYGVVVSALCRLKNSNCFLNRCSCWEIINLGQWLVLLTVQLQWQHIYKERVTTNSCGLYWLCCLLLLNQWQKWSPHASNQAWAAKPLHKSKCLIVYVH